VKNGVRIGVVGLVFDPLDDPLAKKKFMIVQAQPFASSNDTLTKF
jgi:hypothetical protein